MSVGKGVRFRAATIGAVIAVGLTASAPSAGAVWPGTVGLTAASPRVTYPPAGVSAVHVVAVGGRGGGANGGFGAVVSGTIPLRSREALRQMLGVNGVLGAAVTDPAERFGILGRSYGSQGGALDAGSGGGQTSLTAAYGGAVVAAGGGGSGGPSVLGGAGGNAGGAGGNAGAVGAPGSSRDGVLAATGGAVGASGAPGPSGRGGIVDPDSGCTPGGDGGADGTTTGATRTPAKDASGRGGAGGRSDTSIIVGGAGGGGGAGVSFGGGGGGGGACAAYSTSGGGGGGGTSVVPAGGTIAVDTTGQPSLTLIWIHERTAPAITVSSPRPNAVIAPGASVVARFRCADERGGSGVESCVGSVPQGGRLTTDAPGSFSFTVTASDHWGNTSTVTVPYVVGDRTAPRIVGLRVSRSRGRLQLEFGVSERAGIRVHVERRMRGVRANGRCVTKPVARTGGRRCVRWRNVGVVVSRSGIADAKIALGHRLLGDAPPRGLHRVVVVATDDADNTSRIARRTFTVRAATRRPAARAGTRRTRSSLFTSR